MPNPVQIVIQGNADFRQIEGSFTKLGEAAKGCFEQLKEIPLIEEGIAAASAALTIEGMTVALEKFSEAAKNMAKLDAVLKSTKQSGAEFREELEKQRASFSNYLGVEEQQLATVQRLIIQYGASKEQIETLTGLSFDLAASQGIDVASAANELARALGGQEVQLRGVRLEIDHTLPKYEQVNSMIRQLTTQVGGQGRAAFLAATPDIDRFKVAVNEAKEEMGGLVAASIEGWNALGLFGGLDFSGALEKIKDFYGQVLLTNEKALEAIRQSGYFSTPFANFFASFARPDEVPKSDAQTLHDRKMGQLALDKTAQQKAAELSSGLGANQISFARDEAAYQQGKISLAAYLKARASMIKDERALEEQSLNEALKAVNSQLIEKKTELEAIAPDGQGKEKDYAQIEKLQSEINKLSIDAAKINAGLIDAKQKSISAGINLDQFQHDNPTSLGGAITKVHDDYAKQWTDHWKTAADIMESSINGAIDSISHGITGLIEGTTTWGQVLKNIGTSLLTTVIDGIVKMFAAWVLGQQTATAATIAGKAAEEAVELAKQAATLPGKLVDALATAIGEGGWGAVAIIAAAVAALGVGVAAAAGAFAEGGRPPVGQVALVGERGPELFVPDTSGTIIPAHVTSEILNGNSRAGGSTRRSSRGPGTVIHLHVWGDDAASMQKNIDSHPGVQHAVLNLVSKQRHMVLRQR